VTDAEFHKEAIRLLAVLVVGEWRREQAEQVAAEEAEKEGSDGTQSRGT
jgi:hypothetical protein